MTTAGAHTTMDTHEILHRFPFYRSASPERQAYYASVAQPARLAAGDEFYREGGEIRGVAFVGAGNIRVSRTDASGRELHLYHVQGGEACIVNMLCAFLGRPALADARVEAPTVAAVLLPAQFRALVGADDAVRAFVFDAFARRLTDVMTLADEIAYGRVGARIESLLLQQFARRKTIDATHEWIAAEVGTAREVASRLLKDLERRGAIALGRGRIHLRDRARLAGGGADAEPMATPGD